MVRVELSSLIEEISREYETTKDHERQRIDFLLAFIIRNCIEGNRVCLRGFGTFYLRHLPSRVVHKPGSKDKIVAAPQSVIRFKPAVKAKHIIVSLPETSQTEPPK